MWKYTFKSSNRLYHFCKILGKTGLAVRKSLARSRPVGIQAALRNIQASRQE